MNFEQIQEVKFSCPSPTKKFLVRRLKNAINSLYERLRDERVDFSSVNKVYFRFEASVNWERFESDLFTASRELEELALSRFPSAKSSLLFCSDYEHKLTDMNGKTVPDFGKELEKIRNEELHKMVSDSGALYEGNRYHYFRLPSGRTADCFLRTGNCLAKMENAYIFSFWALPSLQQINLIICDTWSISTLGMLLARLGERYSGERYECQYLSKYLDNDFESVYEVEEILDQAAYGNVVPLFLVSAVSSGRSLKTFTDAFEIFTIDKKPKILVLYLMNGDLLTSCQFKSNLDILCHFGPILEGKGLQGFTDEFVLANDQQIFSIDAETYFPRYFEAREREFKVVKFAKSPKPFFERYAGLDLFSVCRYGASNKKLNARRHHSFHVDIHNLVKTEEFRIQVEDKLRELALRPTCIVHLEKPADKTMANVLKNVFSSQSQLVQTVCIKSYQSIDSCDEILCELKKPEARIMFIDAMHISGQSTAQDFQQGLRNGLKTNKSNKHNASIFYLIGLLRPDLTIKIANDVEKMISCCCPTRNGKIRVAIVETVLLPNWDERDCPWCIERKLHSSLLQKHSRDMSDRERMYIEERKNLLTNCRKHGLKNELFFKRYPKHRFLFGESSLWFDTAKVEVNGRKHSEADVMLSVASALQYWRDDYLKLPPAQYLLDQQTCFSVNKFNDSFLRTAIWRSLQRQEVDTFPRESYRKDLLNRVFDVGGEADDVDEFVLGWEAAFLLGRYLSRIVGYEKFEKVDWNYLKWTAQSR